MSVPKGNLKKENVIVKPVTYFVMSAIDHALNDAKTPSHVVNMRFEEWKKERADIRTEDQEADENYIIQYGSKRAEYEDAYKQWHSTRADIFVQSKKTGIIGEQEKRIKDLTDLPFPEILSNPVPDVYTKYKPNK